MRRRSCAAAALMSWVWAATALAQVPTTVAKVEEAPPVAPPAPPAPAAAPTTAAPAPATPDGSASATPAEQPLPAAPAPPPPVTAPAPAPAPAPEPAPVVAPSRWSTRPTNAASPVKRSRFFSTLQLGGGYFHASSGSSQDTRRFGGGTVSGALAIGGRVGKTRNVALAGAFVRDQVYALRSKDQLIDGDEPDLHGATFALWALGFMVDVGTQAEPGLHFQGLVGVGALSVSLPSGDPEDPSGLMASLAAGYDFKVSEHFAVGALLRGTYAPLDIREVTGTTVYVLVPALLLTATSR